MSVGINLPRVCNNVSTVFVLIYEGLIGMKANIISQVIEYLSKKGYSKTEAMLRMESANQDVDGRVVPSKTEEPSAVKYGRGFSETLRRS